MIVENELVVFLQGIALLAFFLGGGTRIKQLMKWRVFLLAYGLLSAGWMFTVVEGFVFYSVFNFLEHVFYTAGSLTLAFWCWSVFQKEGENVT